MATYSCILAWEIPWTEEVQSLGSQRVSHDWVTNTTQQQQAPKIAQEEFTWNSKEESVISEVGREHELPTVVFHDLFF